MKNNADMHPVYLGWQVDWPLFVKIPFSSGGRNWIKGEEFKWAELSVEQDRVAKLYSISYVHHNPALEKQNKVGDRLHEMSSSQLHSLVIQLNAELKSRTVSQKDYDKNRCRQSKIDTSKEVSFVGGFTLTNGQKKSTTIYEIKSWVKWVKLKRWLQMPKFRKKPVVIEAIRWDGGNIKEVMDFLRWRNASHDDVIGLSIHTLEGTHHASVGDWIIKGVQGEFYPCKPEIFQITYEPDSCNKQEILRLVLRSPTLTVLRN